MASPLSMEHVVRCAVQYGIIELYTRWYCSLEPRGRGGMNNRNGMGISCMIQIAISFPYYCGQKRLNCWLQEMSRIETFVMFFLDLALELVHVKGDGENLPVPFAITAIYSKERISDDTF